MRVEVSSEWTVPFLSPWLSGSLPSFYSVFSFLSLCFVFIRVEMPVNMPKGFFGYAGLLFCIRSPPRGLFRYFMSLLSFYFLDRPISLILILSFSLLYFGFYVPRTIACFHLSAFVCDLFYFISVICAMVCFPILGIASSINL